MSQSIEKFIESRRPRWKRLETLIQYLEQGKARELHPSELPNMGRLYREATADLARLQAFQEEGSLPDELVDYLNHLVARAHGQIYRSPAPGWSQLKKFLRYTLPQTFRETAPWTLAAMGIFLLGSTYGFIAGLFDDSFIPLVAPPHLIQKVEGGKGLVRFHSGGPSPRLQHDNDQQHLCDFPGLCPRHDLWPRHHLYYGLQRALTWNPGGSVSPSWSEC